MAGAGGDLATRTVQGPSGVVVEDDWKPLQSA